MLDVGCGRGAFLKKIHKTFDVKGFEKNPDAIGQLAKEGIEFDTGEDKYDFIVSFQALEHVENPKVFLEDAFGKLNAGGYLLVTVPNSNS